MATLRSAMFICMLVLGTILVGTASVSAQPVHGFPYGYIHERPYFANNLVRGDVVEVGIWLEMLPGEPMTTVRYEGMLGRLPVRADVTASGPSLNFVVDYVSAEDIMSQCVDGVIQVTGSVLIQDEKGNFSIVYGSQAYKTTCSWSNLTATPNMPVQYQICGDNNDSITVGRQPRGLTWQVDVWDGNSLAVKFFAEPGFTLVGTDGWMFVDAGPCVASPPVAPVQVFICGANNDELVMLPQPTHVYLAIDTGWINQLRKLQFLADVDYALAVPGNMQFTDDANRGCALPLPSPPVTEPPYMVPTPRVFNPVLPFPGLPTPGELPLITVVPLDPYPNTPEVTPRVTPEPDDKSDEKKDDSAEPVPGKDGKETPKEKSESDVDGNVAILAFAPAALLTGIIAAGYRGHHQ